MIPNSPTYLTYSMFSLIVLGYDLALAPFLVVWDIPLVGALHASVWITSTFWTIDIGISSNIGFYRGGEVLSVRGLCTFRLNA